MIDSSTIAFLGSIGWMEMAAIALIGLLIFGKRLPEVGKSLGKGIVEFKKGLAGIEDDVDQGHPTSSSSQLTSKSSSARIEPHVDSVAMDTPQQVPSADQKDHAKP